MGLEEVETSLPLGSCPTEIDKGTTGRGESNWRYELPRADPQLGWHRGGMTATTPVRGVRGILVSISLGLSPDFGNTGGYQHQCGGREILGYQAHSGWAPTLVTQGGYHVTASELKNSERITPIHPQQNTSFVHEEDHTTQCLEIALLPWDDHSTFKLGEGSGGMDQKRNMTDCPSPCPFLLLEGTLALTTLESCRGGVRTLTGEVALLVAAQTQKGTPGLSTLPLRMN